MLPMPPLAGDVTTAAAWVVASAAIKASLAAAAVTLPSASSEGAGEDTMIGPPRRQHAAAG
eukprot:CAMPEP_0115758004 /NCGR_PEP_ID=MMETSP0272-20121206/98712_1 /TAXON_ID=71861 /ORGANISM="Scrippsiella trochoidea, Strain CCMP3099" /LENGTH=60 /DNA_ID=CAMNT_0003203529 /DNA_START=294 /DNA_END=472 /DNA_ORIENTATION=-